MCVLMCLLGLAGPVLSAPAKRTPPDPAAIKESQRLVMEVFRSDFAAAKRRDDKLVLAEKLRTAAQNPQNDDAGRYSLLSYASNLAAENGDFGLALSCITELARLFELDDLSLRADAMSRAAKAITGNEANLQFIAVSNELIQLSAEAERFDVARQLCDTALVAARKLDNAPLVIELGNRAREMLALDRMAREGIKAQETLKATPDDASAHARLGKYLCFLRNDWPQGLEHLSKSDDPALKSLAEKDLAANTADLRITAGEAWYTAGEKQTSLLKKQFHRRAAQHLSAALPELTGLARLRVTNRLEQMGGPVAPSASLPAVKVREIVVEALVEGDCELHLTPKGLYWTTSGLSKPGRHTGGTEPTFINDKPWSPTWQKPDSPDAEDRSDLYPLEIASPLDYQLHVLSISRNRGEKLIEERDPVSASEDGEELVITIPDRQSGARWYRLRLKRN